MSQFSIKDLENLTGIKAHTIRIWEQRYGLLQPKRTKTNIRYYSDDDLKFLLNVGLLNKSGFKISKIAKMSNTDIQHQVILITENNFEYETQVAALNVAMLELNESMFERVLSSNIIRMGFEDTMMKVIFPFLYQVGILWQTDVICPAHEHFITNLIRQKLIVAIDGQYGKEEFSSSKFLLFLPEGEMHEIGMLFVNYLLRSRGCRVIYLGQNVPYEDLEQVYTTYKPDYLVTSFTGNPDGETPADYLQKLTQKFSQCRVLISSHALSEAPDPQPDNLILIDGYDAMIRFFDHNLHGSYRPHGSEAESDWENQPASSYK